MNELRLTRGIKIIHHNASGINEKPSERFFKKYPWAVVIGLSPPKFMRVAFVLMMGGCETLVIRGKSRGALVRFIRINKLNTHPRLINFTISSPDGDEEKFDRHTSVELLQPS